MSTRLNELMLHAGYAAPELAGRAKQLASNILQDVHDTILFVYLNAKSDEQRAILNELQAELARRLP